jgi:CHAD domain-containing protein
MAIHGSEKKRETIIHSSNFISRDIETHQKRFAAALRSRRQARLFQDLRNLSGIPPRGRATLSLLAAGALRKSIKRVKKRARKVATNPSDRRLHRLRIALRILRYQCEFFESLDRVVLRRFSRRTVPLQRDLGHHQDATMSLTLLESRAGRHLPDFLEGAFRDSLEHTRRKTRKAFFRLWKDYWERSLPELEKMLERWRKRQVR